MVNLRSSWGGKRGKKPEKHGFRGQSVGTRAVGGETLSNQTYGDPLKHIECKKTEAKRLGKK